MGQGASSLQSAKLVWFLSELIWFCWQKAVTTLIITVRYLINSRFVGGGEAGDRLCMPPYRASFLASLITIVLTDGTLLRDKAAVLRHSTRGTFCVYCTAHEKLNSR